MKIIFFNRILYCFYWIKKEPNHSATPAKKGSPCWDVPLISGTTHVGERLNEQSAGFVCFCALQSSMLGLFGLSLGALELDFNSGRG